VAGHIPVMMAPLNAVLQFINDKQLYPIALSDGSRTKYLPDVPTLTEAGIDNMPPVTSWFAVLTTGGTPPATAARLNAEIARILRDEKVQQRLASQTFEIKGGTPEELMSLMQKDAATNAKIVTEAKIKPE
jgi:tripartite-type tricarboxylate transporter receptor subunit TctC